MKNNKKKLIKKVTLGIVLIAAISVIGYYAYLNVFINQYELTYEIQKNKNWEPSLRSYKFLARNDSIAAEEAVDWLVYQFIFDNPDLEEQISLSV